MIRTVAGQSSSRDGTTIEPLGDAIRSGRRATKSLTEIDVEELGDEA